jgi:hypothetical protein
MVRQGNHFMQAGHQVFLGPGVNKAVVVGNVMEGPFNITDQTIVNKAQVGLNAYDGDTK